MTLKELADALENTMKRLSPPCYWSLSSTTMMDQNRSRR